MKKVLIIGPLLSISGYGYHSRQVFDYFYNKENTDVSCVILPWGNTSWFVNENLENGLIKKIISCSVASQSLVQKSFDLGVHIQLPNEWNTQFATKNIGVSAFVETSSCNPEWLKSIFTMDHVIVPSSFTKNVIINTTNDENVKQQLNNNISVIPEYYHVDFDLLQKQKTNNITEILDNTKTSFNFLTVGQLTSEDASCDRKNLVSTIKYFCNHYKDDEEKGLIVKTSSGRATTKDKEKTRKAFSEIMNSIGKDKKSFPRVYLLQGEFTPLEMYSLYTHPKTKCYLSLTRGEGYGLPLLESARCGLPIIATNWSGHLDFLKDKFTKIDFDLQNIPNRRIDNSIFIQNTKWAEVRESSVYKSFNDITNNYEKSLQLSNSLKSEIKKDFSRKNIVSLYDDLLTSLSFY